MLTTPSQPSPTAPPQPHVGCFFSHRPRLLFADALWLSTVFDKFDDDLAEIATVQHRQESGADIVEPVHNVFAVANGAIADALCDVVKKLVIEVFRELIVDVPAQRETFG